MREPTLYFEDFAAGQVVDLGAYEMTEAEIIEFGTRFDPQYFHIDPAAAADSVFGGLIASGWHTVSAWARLWIDTMLCQADSRGSPGMEQVRWLVPVRPGDTLRGSVEILETRPSRRHADRGTVFIRCTMTNQHGQLVFSAEGRGHFGRRRPAQSPAETPEADTPEADTPEAKLPEGDKPGADPPAADSDAVEVTSDDGVRLHLRRFGGTGPDLLVCHATGFHARAYRPLAERLAERFVVWALDFRGHGSSGPAPDDDYAWRGMGSDVSACVEAIGAPVVYGFGHSMGGTALLLAERSQPGTFERVFLYEPIVFPRGFLDVPGANPLVAAARNRREVFNSRAEALERYASRSPLSVMRADALAAYVEGGFVDLDDGRVRLACSPETEARTFEAGGALSTEDAPGISVPATVAAGTVISGGANPGLFAAAVAEALPYGRLVTFDDLGHFGPLQAPGVVAASASAELLGS